MTVTHRKVLQWAHERDEMEWDKMFADPVGPRGTPLVIYLLLVALDGLPAPLFQNGFVCRLCLGSATWGIVPVSYTHLRAHET